MLIYGAALAVLLFILRWLELRFLIIDHAIEIYIGAIAIFFTVLGIWLALKLAAPKIKTVVIEKEVLVERNDFKRNEEELARLGLSRREVEVLELMAGGLSNNEIAGKLFLSLNTIKTHNSKVLEKLDVKRRTQAVDKAKKLRIIP